MASVTDTATREHRRRLVSPLTLRILAVNLLALAIPVAGLLYLGHYQDRLIQTELKALLTEARIFASALGEGAMTRDDTMSALDPDASRAMVRRLVETTETRTRLYGLEGRMIADSLQFGGPFNQIQAVELPPPADPRPWAGLGDAIRRVAAQTLPEGRFPPFHEEGGTDPSLQGDVVRALDGEPVTRVWRFDAGAAAPRMVLTVVVPVQHYRQVQGAVLVMRGSDGIDAAVRSVRADILSVFGMTLAVTVLLSVFLAGTIARPIRKLAWAADRLRRGHGRAVEIPDLTSRCDEIGDLSGVLRDMMGALRARMDAIERFAADVAHEIKNPLTSLRSAVETAERVADPARRERLMAIISDDVRRLDRLITDISRASRIDAELSRGEPERVDLADLLATLASLRPSLEDRAGEDERAPVRIVFEHGPGAGLTVTGLPGRLSQVFENLLSNALSFSPSGGVVRIAAVGTPDMVTVTVTDEGPGIPAGKERAVFERFYSERPAGEKFGIHSGLGLSISRQIVEAHGGTITAGNRRSPDDRILGAVFTVRLPRGGFGQ